MTLTYPEQGVDLNSCDLEPIHIIGRIQTFGTLVTVSSDWIISRASTNCAALLGRSAQEAIGLSASEFFTPAAVDQIRARLSELQPGQVERLFNLALTHDGRSFDLALYRSGRHVVMEVEPAAPQSARDYLSLVRPMMQATRKAADLADLCDIAARQMRRLTGFDRVKVYRFDAEGAGEVVAEARGDGIDSFLGLHFPASDIPRQARLLYTQNLLRIISDVDDTPAEIYPTLDFDGAPLDLSHSGLRAVSPIHIEYLRNMGVKASMSVSILRNGELWGLFACHHYSPLTLPYGTRTAAELFGEFFSGALEQMEIRKALTQRDTATHLHDALMAQVANGGSLLANFDRFADLIRQVIPFDGIVGYVAGEYVARGDTPARQQFLDLARFLNTTGNGACWSTHHLGQVYPPAAGFGEHACGLLAVPVSRVPRDFIVLFRGEYAHEVQWAGEPTKPMQAGPLGDRLTPRKSFALWTEERRGQARPWSGEETAIAEKLRVTLIEVILQVLDASHAEREAAARRQQDLIAELNHRVRNSLTMIGSMVNQGRRDTGSLQDFCTRVGARIATLARAHDQVNATSWTPFPLSPLIHETVKAIHPLADAQVRVSGPQVYIRPSAFTTLCVVLHELASHSAALAAPEGKVAVTLAQTATGELAMEWRDTGGTPRLEWQDRLAQAILERSIPHDLGGEAHVALTPEGLVAHVLIPAERVEFMTDTATTLPIDALLTQTAESSASLLSRRALVVEDNIIIGMEAEDQLLALGASQVDLANNVAQALRLIGQNSYEFALLDVNLGNESSQPVAEELRALGTPYAFSTGYGEVPWAKGTRSQAPVVTKPLDSIALERAIVAAQHS